MKDASDEKDIHDLRDVRMQLIFDKRFSLTKVLKALQVYSEADLVAISSGSS